MKIIKRKVKRVVVILLILVFTNVHASTTEDLVGHCKQFVGSSGLAPSDIDQVKMMRGIICSSYFDGVIAGMHVQYALMLATAEIEKSKAPANCEYQNVSNLELINHFITYVDKHPEYKNKNAKLALAPVIAANGCNTK